jgi:hypothetical protein
MKIILPIPSRHTRGYALMMVLGITAVTMMILGATMMRTSTVALLNERNNQLIVNINAAEAATEKVFSLMSYDFQGWGLGQVYSRISAYRDAVPTINENSYWGNFEFSNGTQEGKTYVEIVQSNYTGYLPSQYKGLIAMNSPVYRVLSNVKSKTGNTNIVGTVQQDIMLALVPVTTYAIFYNGLLEFSTCATMVVNGRVHANSNIYVGAGSGATLTFNGNVTASGTVTAPANAGSSWTSPGVLNSGWRTTFNDDFTEHVPTVALSINMTNTRSLIEMPLTNALHATPTTQNEKAQMMNQAHVILLVTNANFTLTNSKVTLKIQTSPGTGQVPGEDTSATIITNMSYHQATSSLPFLNLAVRFKDNREKKTNIVTQIDMGKYNQWLTAATNSLIQAKFPAASGQYPTVLYVNDQRPSNSNNMTSVRITNAVAIPNNGGRGFTLATPNPLYVLGNYNAPNPASTNTANALPSALMTDALTVLSTKWSDSRSLTENYSDSDSDWEAASSTTVNAAILTGIVKSSGTGINQFSGGVHNLTRMLENWSGSTLWLNTSIINLFDSGKATNKFVYPGQTGTYYRPPTRRFSYDLNFLDPAKQPPGIPSALVAIRFNWAVPPPGVTTYNVVP